MTKNPLSEEQPMVKTPEPCILVIFGATGDLTARKLVPALYNLAYDGQLPPHFALVGFARREKDNATFRTEMLDAIGRFSRTKPIDETVAHAFSGQIFYHRSAFDDDEGYRSLEKQLAQIDKELGTKGNRIFYLSTPPSYFPDIIAKLSANGLIYDSHETGKWSRVIIEKPFGRDLESALQLQDEITHHLDEKQIYRIDHYLGKETVQNLFVFRFENPIFEAVWNSQHIEQVQITVAEEIGIETRGNFFEKAGILRDIVQNHMMQLLALTAMEPPKNFDAESIRIEKIKVLQALRPFPEEEFDTHIMRGQYAKGFVNGDPVVGYREEADVSRESSIETFAAMKLFIDNPRWAGTPFFLRAGKRLPKRATEIAITFKNAANALVIRIQPNEGINLKINCKVPGWNGPVQPVKMDFLYSAYFGGSPPDAYERLILDCMAGDGTLFAHIDEVIASWNLFDPVLSHWEREPPPLFPNYPAGTWGPLESDWLIGSAGHTWRLI